MTDKNNGLTEKEVEISREKNGSNKLSQYKKKSFMKGFFSNMGDPIIRVLIGALFINIIFMFPNINWFESGGIAAAVFIATFVSTVSEYSSENAFEKLRNQDLNVRCLVKREGTTMSVLQEELVVGDVIILEAGSRVHADASVFSGEVSVDESALTGESAEVIKHAPSNEDKDNSKILRGSLICSGYAEAVVESVGVNTFYGKVAKELSRDTRPSPLKYRLAKLAKTISFIGYIASAMIAFAYLFNVLVIDSHFVWSEVAAKISDIKFLLSKLLSALTLAVSIIVVAVPEGLPMMITVVLSSNMSKMMKDHVLVRKLVGIETSGNINILFTDKTGTLTEGALKVKEIHSASGEKYTSFSSLKEKEEYFKFVSLCANYCNSAVLSGKNAIGSDATDRAILEYFGREKTEAEVTDKIPFDSRKKYSMASVRYDGKDYVLIKGAAEKILSASHRYVSDSGEIKIMTRNDTDRINRRIKDLAKSSYRIITLGMKDNTTNFSLEDVVFIGLLAIRDKIRKEVPSAIKRVTEAGVGVVMITGDNADTARAIAEECGIISPLTKRNLVITGTQLSNMTDDEVAFVLGKTAVIARALPSDKSRLVEIAQKTGLVVGMTGDGINDASSLKAADVGFAMGSGTDVAKEACDIIISDNNFASIVKAILYGRTIFESIRKFIVFQLTMNFGAVGICFVGPFIGIENPVTVTQMLWVNIIMDTLGALAFACEPPQEEYMKIGPKKRDENLISREMVNQIFFTASYILALCIWFLKSDTLKMILRKADERYILSAFFAMFIFLGVFVCFTSRTTRINILAHLSKNKSFISIMILISVMQMAFIYFGGDTFRAKPLIFHDLICVILISFSVVIFDFIRKVIYKLTFTKKKKVLSGKRNAYYLMKQ